MNKKYILGLVLLVLSIFFLYNVFSKGNGKSVATVDGSAILKKDLDEKIASVKTYYTFSKQDLKNYPSLEKDALDRLIEKALLEEFAKENNITISDKEVQERYEGIIKGKNESDFLNKLSQMYSINKNQYLEVVKEDILRERVQAKVKIPLLEWLNQEKNKSKILINEQTLKDSN